MALLCVSVKDLLSIDWLQAPKRHDTGRTGQYLRLRLPGLHFASLVSGVRTQLAGSPLGAGFLLKQLSKEVFPMILDFRHYESAASLGTTVSIHQILARANDFHARVET